VQNIHNYVINDRSTDLSAKDVADFLLLGKKHDNSRRLALRSAVYDASTNTVTLNFRQPQKGDGPFEVTNGPLLATRGGGRRRNKHNVQPLTDIQGDQIAPAQGVAVGRGFFDVTVTAP
jgi:hypothetical protein